MSNPWLDGMKSEMKKAEDSPYKGDSNPSKIGTYGSKVTTPSPKTGSTQRLSNAYTALTPNDFLNKGMASGRTTTNTRPLDIFSMAGNALKVPFKIASRGQDALIKQLDDLSGASAVGATGRGDKRAGYLEDTGSEVGNILGDTLGTGAMFALTPGGMGGATLQKGLTPIGNLAENYVARGLSKAAPVLPGAVNKVANYIIPTAARAGAEGAALGAGEGWAKGEDAKGIASDALNTGAQFVGFSLGMKGAGDVLGKGLNAFNKAKLANAAKINEKAPESVQTESMASIPDNPLTLNEGLNTLYKGTSIATPKMPEIKTETNSNPLQKLYDISTPKIKDEVPFYDEQGRYNAGTVNKVNTDGTIEIKSPEGTTYNVKKNGENYETVLSESTPKDQIPMNERIGNDAIKDKNVKAYQFLHPELKGHIQQEAEIMLQELKGTTRGEKFFTPMDTGHGEIKITGNQRITSSEIASLLNDNHSYADIEKALNNIVKDHGAENTVLAKKIETLIDQRLSHGYQDFASGFDIPANDSYIGMKNAIEGQQAKVEPTPATSSLNVFNNGQKINRAAEESSTLHPAMGATDRTHISMDIVSGAEADKIGLRDAIKKGANKFYTAFIEKNKAISDFSKAANDETYIKATNSANSSTIVNHVLDSAMVDMKGNPIDISYRELIQNLPKDKEGFTNFLLQLHNIDRAREGKPVDPQTTAEQSIKAVKLILQKNPEWKAEGEKVTKWINKFMAEWGNKSGMVSDDLWKSLNETYKNYLPTNREFTDIEGMNLDSNGRGFTGQSIPMKRATGSDRNIIDPFESMINTINRTIRGAKYNEVGQTMLESIRKDPQGLKKYAEELPEGTEITPRTHNIVTVLDKGKKVDIQVNDKELLKALEGFQASAETPIQDALRAITNPYKALITTKNPLFTVFNVARDIPTAYVNGSEHNPFKFAKNYGSAFNDLRTRNEVAQKYNAVGGGGSNFDYNGNTTQGLKQLSKPLNVFQKVGRNIENANNMMESVPRLAEFKNTLNKGGSLDQALFNANEITTNFSRNGKITKTLDSGTPYLNASVQGLDKSIRQFIAHPGSTAAKGIISVTIPTLALDAINADNPNYQALDNRTKDTYFLFPNPVDNGETFIRIPKSREIGVLFGSLAERAIRAANGEQDAFKGFGGWRGTVATNFGPANPLESNLFTPFLTNLPSNKDFAGRTIVPQSMKDSRFLKDQWDETTSKIGIQLGQLTGLSPKQIDYVIKSYTGIIGQVLLPATTDGNGNVGNVLGNIVTRKFTADPLYSNQSTQDFYDNLDMLKREAGSNNFLNDINSKKVTPQERVANRFAKVSTELTKLSKQAAKETDEDKIRELRQRMVDLATKANESLK